MSIPFFDVFIFENGSMRLVDKKHYFNARDKNRIMLEASDIVVIGTGFRNKGGKACYIRHPHDLLRRQEQKTFQSRKLWRLIPASLELNRTSSEQKEIYANKSTINPLIRYCSIY